MVKFSELQIGDYSGIREYNRNPDFFMKSFLPPITFELESLRNDRNFIIVGRKGTGKSSCCLALAHKKIAHGYSSDFYNFSDELNRSDLRDTVRTQSLNLKDISTKKLFDSVTELYDFRDLWRRKVLHAAAKRLSGVGEKSNFISFLTSTEIKESSIAEGVGRGMCIPMSSELEKFLPKIFARLPRDNTITLKEYNDIGLSLLKSCHPDIKMYFFFDELNLSHTKSGSDEYETLIALVRDIIRATADLNDFFALEKLDIHIVCAIRPEVRNEIIQRDGELSKTIDSNFVNLSWPSQARYTNPLIDILKRKLSHSHVDISDANALIPESVYVVSEKRSVPFPTYFLNITWYRPRDVIRVLKCYQITNGGNNSLFQSQDDQFGFLKEYSRVSRQDIVAELEVKYSRELISEVLNCIKKPIFYDVDELLNYLDILSNRIDLQELVTDLFQAGVILNHDTSDGKAQVYASYRNDDVLDRNLRIIIHRGLQPSLHLGFELNWDASEDI